MIPGPGWSHDQPVRQVRFLKETSPSRPLGPVWVYPRSVTRAFLTSPLLQRGPVGARIGHKHTGHLLHSSTRILLMGTVWWNRVLEAG